MPCWLTGGPRVGVAVVVEDLQHIAGEPVDIEIDPEVNAQPGRTRDPTPTHVRAARQLGTSPPAHQLRAERSRRAARTRRRPRALARVHGRAAPLAPWLRYPTAITERSRAPERGLPRCYQPLVTARQSTMSQGRRRTPPSCLTRQRQSVIKPDPAPEKRKLRSDRVTQDPPGQMPGRGASPGAVCCAIAIGLRACSDNRHRSLSTARARVMSGRACHRSPRQWTSSCSRSVRSSVMPGNLGGAVSGTSTGVVSSRCDCAVRQPCGVPHLVSRRSGCCVGTSTRTMRNPSGSAIHISSKPHGSRSGARTI